MLTFNRADLLERTISHNVSVANSLIDELVWVDNGSKDERVEQVMRQYDPHISVLNRTNVGVFRGYNQGFALATGDYIVITDDDMLMPAGWLASFKEYLRALPDTGVACIQYDNPNLLLRNVQLRNGLAYHPCYPIGRFLVRRDLLVKKIGFFREDFGLFGLGDIEWARRAVRVCKEEKLLTYALPGPRCEHLGTADRDPTDYLAFKRKEESDPHKLALLRRCRAENYPYYNPFS